MTDRGFWVAGSAVGGNVRRLMYQALIWLSVGAGILRDDARRLGPPFDAENLERLADALIDGVRRDAELGGDLLRAEVLVDEPQAIELPGAKPRNPFRYWVVNPLPWSPPMIIRKAV